MANISKQRGGTAARYSGQVCSCGASAQSAGTGPSMQGCAYRPMPVPCQRLPTSSALASCRKTPAPPPRWMSLSASSSPVWPSKAVVSRATMALGRGPKRLSAEAMSRVMGYKWPGNVRELENEVERLVVLSGDVEEIDEMLLSPQIRASEGGDRVRRGVESAGRS